MYQLIATPQTGPGVFAQEKSAEWTYCSQASPLILEWTRVEAKGLIGPIVKYNKLRVTYDLFRTGLSTTNQ